jgi:hypothetical protein
MNTNYSATASVSFTYTDNISELNKQRIKDGENPMTEK